MIFCCSVCCKEFKTNWQLQRHYSNKRPCSQEICIYCNKLFSRKDGKERPEKTCNENNEIRHMEIDLGIEYPKINKFECRYCNKVLSTASHRKRHWNTCKKQNEYRQLLYFFCS